ncbi:MAG: hypothetical protein J7559_08535, partial [Cohnella sp.]|nr:hypothetical protein [Cohnella sp.]
DNMTPRELILHVEEYNERLIRDRNDRVSQAYMTAYLHRVKKMPKLEKLLERNRPKKSQSNAPQTPEEQLQAALHWNKQRMKKEG